MFALKDQLKVENFLLVVEICVVLPISSAEVRKKYFLFIIYRRNNSWLAFSFHFFSPSFTSREEKAMKTLCVSRFIHFIFYFL